MNRHSMVHSLKILRDLTPIATIIDVGVANETQELVYLFPDKPHILFEPNTALYSVIHQHYTSHNIEYTLRETAVDRVMTLDGEMSNLYYNSPYLLKIDVDGSELEVLAGAVDTLPFCSCAVVECTVGAGVTTMMQLLNFFNLHNFSLWDIVNMSYCQDHMWQVDIVLVNNKSNVDRLRLKDNPGYRFVDPEVWITDPDVISGEFLLKK